MRCCFIATLFGSLVLLSTARSARAQAFVQQGTNFAGSATTATPSISVKNSGDAVCLNISLATGSEVVSSVSDSNRNGNGWNKIIGLSDSTNEGDLEIWCSFGHAAGATGITVGHTGNGAPSWRVQPYELSGVTAANAEVAGTTGQIKTTQDTPATGPLSNSPAIVIAALWHGWNTTLPASGPIDGFNAMTAASSASLLEGAYLAVSSTASRSTGWDWAATTKYDSVIASFYTPGTYTTPPRLLDLGSLRRRIGGRRKGEERVTTRTIIIRLKLTTASSTREAV